LAAPYCASSGDTDTPAPEPTLTMAPRFRASIPGNRRRVIHVVESTLRLINCATRSSSNSWKYW